MDAKDSFAARQQVNALRLVSLGKEKLVSLRDMVKNVMLRTDKILYACVWIDGHDPQFEVARMRNLGRGDSVWSLYKGLMRAGIDVTRIKLEHLLLNKFAANSC